MAEAKKKMSEEKNTKKDKAGGTVYHFHDKGNVTGNGHDDAKVENHDIVNNSAEIIVNITGDKIDSKFIEELSEWLKKNRKEHKMTQKDVADKSKIDLKYYQKLESKKIAIEPRMTTISKLAQVFGYEGTSFLAR